MTTVTIDLADGVELQLELEDRDNRKAAYERAARHKAMHGCACGHAKAAHNKDGVCTVVVEKFSGGWKPGKCPCAELRRQRVPKQAAPPPEMTFADLVIDEEAG